ncbi:MAG TPA: rhodanese-like domain-containing protein [Blastocatellia bacterium]|nr:rhodanese-like domain-containing protein [Blastocatellia bacterium]
MSNKRCVGVLAIALALAFEALSFAAQGPFGLKPKPKAEEQTPIEFIAPQELKTKIANQEPVSIVDLRGPTAYASADKTIVGAVHAKVRRVVYRLREFPRDREVITYCECPADEAAIIGARSLIANGFKRVRVLKGGWKAWLQAGGQLRPRPR